MKKTPIETLKLNYHRYIPLWNEWTENKHNGLTEDDIYLVNAHALNNFSSSVGITEVMFFSRKEGIDTVSKKLETTYPEFQEWVILKFLFAIVELTLKYDQGVFLCTQIKDLSISKKLKMNLLKYGQVTLMDLFETYAEDDFKKDEVFRIVLDSAVLISKSKIINH